MLKNYQPITCCILLEFHIPGFLQDRPPHPPVYVSNLNSSSLKLSISPMSGPASVSRFSVSRTPSWELGDPLVTLKSVLY